MNDDSAENARPESTPRPASARGFDHQPVMLERVLDVFASVPSGTIVDCTLGGAGHASALLAARPDIRLLGIDRDADALQAATAALAGYADRVVLRHARSDQLVDLLQQEGITDVVGVLADLGVSSPQLDRAERGFSYRADHDGPLDMRMSTDDPVTAADLVNDSEPGDLVRLLRAGGEDRHTRRIVSAIVAARPLRTTSELADVVREAVPAPARRRGGDPAKRTFQALRIAVNDELGVLTRTLDQAVTVLVPGGRAAFIAFHGGEDALVKARFRLADDGGCTCPPGLPCGCGAQPEARLVKRGGYTPTPDDIAANPRAASARLRVIEKLSPEDPGT